MWKNSLTRSTAFDKVFDDPFYGLDLFDNVRGLDSGYPKYNIYKTDEGSMVEVAVAGFSKDQLEVSVDKNILEIVGTKKEETEKTSTKRYYHKGIAERSFNLKLNLNEGAEVKDVKLENGILSVKVQTKELEKPKKKVLVIKE